MASSHPHDLGTDLGIDLGTPAQMDADCRAVLRSSAGLERAARRATRPAPSIHFDDQPAEQPKPTVEAYAAAARIAQALRFDLG